MSLTNNMCVQTKGLDVRYVRIGENNLLKRIITTNLEIFFIEGTNQKNITKWVSEIQSYSNIGSDLATLTIGSLSFSNCRILRANFPSSTGGMSDPTIRAVYSLTIEEQLATSNSPYWTSVSSYIDEVDEQIDYRIGVNGQVSINHTVSVTPNNKLSAANSSPSVGHTGDFSSVNAAARSILDSWSTSTNPTGLTATSIHSVYLIAGISGNISNVFNQITGECTWTRSIETLSDVSADNTYTSEATHTLTLDSSGVIKVTEQGKVRYTDVGKRVNIWNIAGEIENRISAASGNCTTFYTNYFADLDDSNGGQAALALKTSCPAEITRNYNQLSQEATYSISFVDDAQVDDSTCETVSRESNVSQDNRGIVNISEKTTLIRAGIKGSASFPNSNAAWYLSDSASAGTRIAAIWATFNDLQEPSVLSANPDPFVFNITKKNVSYNPEGKNVSYNVTYSSDKTLRSSTSTDGVLGIKKIEIKVSDKLPTSMSKEFPIPGRRILIHNTGQSNMGSRTVSLNVGLERSFFNGLGISNRGSYTNEIKDVVLRLGVLAKTELLKVLVDYPGSGIDDMHIADCTWTLDSKRIITLTATMNYTAI